ncbi:MAG: hypothetical protein KF805_08875 [Phycisphaeraceae bacterium]|nr:hypothetical protein [Phycisphaeraceae bacterium]
MAHLNSRTWVRFSVRSLACGVVVAALGACVTRPDAHDHDDDLDKWYVHCRLHDQPWCLGPFRRQKDADQAGWEHEFWLHMSQNTTRTDHEPCGSN